jgi:hypothetical protein
MPEFGAAKDLCKNNHRRSYCNSVFLNALYRKSDLCIPKNETARPCSQFLHSSIRELFVLYIPSIGIGSAYLAAAK